MECDDSILGSCRKNVIHPLPPHMGQIRPWLEICHAIKSIISAQRKLTTEQAKPQWPKSNLLITSCKGQIDGAQQHSVAIRLQGAPICRVSDSLHRIEVAKRNIPQLDFRPAAEIRADLRQGKAAGDEMPFRKRRAAHISES